MADPVQTDVVSIDRMNHYPVNRAYAWLVFAMVFALMLSDYLSRQVINSVFPFLKAEWVLSDTQLGSLVSVVALTVGVMSFPISLLADRIGHVKSATAMAIVWALATLACGYTDNFLMMFIARAFVGFGQAGYGSAGAAILVHAFPARLHSTAMGAFLAAGMFGSVLGVILGGIIAQHFGWQMAFIIIGALGLVLAVSFPLVVKEPPRHHDVLAPRLPLRDVMRALFATRTAIYNYLGAGLAMFAQGAFLAWMPSYLNRYFDVDPARAALGAGVLALASGVGMVVGGNVADRLSRNDRRNRLRMTMLYCLISGIIGLVAFALPHGPLQFILIATALLIGAGFSGPASAVVVEMTPSSIRATAFATLALSFSLLGMAPGPFVTGWIGDHYSLQMAMQLTPLVSLLAALLYFLATKAYRVERPQPFT